MSASFLLYGERLYEPDRILLPEFDAVLDALKTLGEEGYPIEYIRVGENTDDIDEREYNDTNVLAHHIAVRRQIYIW
jgi:hypothetical protein